MPSVSDPRPVLRGDRPALVPVRSVKLLVPHLSRAPGTCTDTCSEDRSTPSGPPVWTERAARLCRGHGLSSVKGSCLRGTSVSCRHLGHPQGLPQFSSVSSDLSAAPSRGRRHPVVGPVPPSTSTKVLTQVQCETIPVSSRWLNLGQVAVTFLDPRSLRG